MLIDRACIGRRHGVIAVSNSTESPGRDSTRRRRRPNIRRSRNGHGSRRSDHRSSRRDGLLLQNDLRLRVLRLGPVPSWELLLHHPEAWRPGSSSSLFEPSKSPSQFFRSIRSAQLIDAETLRLARYGIVTAAENTVTTAMQATAS